MGYAKRSLYLLFSIAIAISILPGCKEEPRKKVNTAPITFTKEGTLSLFRGETDTLLVKLDIEIAEGEYETQTGLMYRESMEPGQGMLFVFGEEAYHSFYMKNTRFPLDIIYINKDLKVTSIVKNAQPMEERSLPSTQPVMYVLEVNAGLSDAWGLQADDRIDFKRF